MQSKSLQLDDYAHIKSGLRSIYYTIPMCRGKGVYIYIPHEHRVWEYASGVQAFVEHYGNDGKQRKVLDVGCGFSPLAPALVMKHGCIATEIDPDEKVTHGRDALLDVFAGGGSYMFKQQALEDAQGEYDAVFCISVMEHIPTDKQHDAWAKLASLVKPGGLLFTTFDYSDDPSKAWQNDDGRETKYHAERVDDVVAQLEDAQFDFESVDTTYHGPQVYDYTFFRLTCIKRYDDDYR